MMKKAKGTVYVLTDKRAIVLEGGWRTNIRSFGPAQLRDLSRTQRADGSGDIVFKSEISCDVQSNNRSVKAIGFFGIDSVKEVEDKIREVAGSN